MVLLELINHLSYIEVPTLSAEEELKAFKALVVITDRLVSMGICTLMADIRHRSTDNAKIISLILGWPAIIIYFFLNDKTNPLAWNGFTIESLKNYIIGSAKSMKDGAVQLHKKNKEDRAKEKLEEKKRREEELAREQKRREEEYEEGLIPGIRHLKSLGFEKLNKTQTLTPISHNLLQSQIKTASPFKISSNRDKYGVQCQMSGVKDNFYLTFYKEGIVIVFPSREASYFLPFDSSVKCEITREFTKLRCVRYDDPSLITIKDDPLNRKLYYSVLRQMSVTSTAHYTKSGNVDQRYTKQNERFAELEWVEYSIYEATNRFALFSSKGWTFVFQPSLDMNYVYNAFSEIYDATERSLPPQDSFVKKNHNSLMIELLNDEDRLTLRTLMSKEYASKSDMIRNANDFLSKVLKQRQKDLHDEVSEYIRNKTVVLGMWYKDCLMALGHPESRTGTTRTRDIHIIGDQMSSSVSGDTLECWKYANGVVLHFTNGELTKIIESEQS